LQFWNDFSLRTHRVKSLYARVRIRREVKPMASTSESKFGHTQEWHSNATNAYKRHVTSWPCLAAAAAAVCDSPVMAEATASRYMNFIEVRKITQCN